MKTYFASPERVAGADLQAHIVAASKNPVIDAVLKTVNGLLAVLNAHRQIVAVNDVLFAMLGITERDAVLGLRPGEAIHCIHAHDMPAGCGTGPYCVTCGAAIAIVASLNTHRPQQRECVATIQRNGQIQDLVFMVRSYPLIVEGEQFLLFFLQDITLQQRRAILERTFFHDINNLVQALQLTSYLLNPHQDARTAELTDRMRQMTTRLAKEIEIQRMLLNADAGDYELTLQEVSLAQIIADLRATIVQHPAAAAKTVHMPAVVPPRQLVTDSSLLLRILTNMLINALEATAAGGEVRLWLEETLTTLTFCVWNNAAIPEEIALRVFQRNFSTKTGVGRGMGTYAMKLFGEQYLQGKVTFVTSAAEGTTFRLMLPL